MVSIVIINYNGLSFIKDCLESLRASSLPDDEIIVVDNASVDNSREYIKKEFPRIKLIELDKNYGFAEANNIGAKAAGGDYLVFLNNDTVVTPGWLKELVTVMEKDPDTGVAGSKILLMDEPHIINSAGGAITFFGGGYDIGFMDSDSEKYNIRSEKGCVCGAAMIVRREEFLQFGGFDGDYFMYFEDVDLCWRYWLYGKKVMYVPSSVIYHKYGGTSGVLRHAPLRVFYGTRNALLNIIKNYEGGNIAFPLFFSFFFHILKTLCFLSRREVNSAVLMLKAYGSFFSLFTNMLVKRKLIQRHRKKKDRYLLDNSLIASPGTSFREFIRLTEI